LRLHYTTGLTEAQRDELTLTVAGLLPEPWDRPTGRPRSLSLRDAIDVTCAYLRQNIIQHVLAEFFEVSQSLISTTIALIEPLLSVALEPVVPTPQKAASSLDGLIALIDGSLAPCWSWKGCKELWAGKQKTTGHNFQVICTTEGECVYISLPVPGSTHDAKAVLAEDVQVALSGATSVIADKGYIGRGFVTPLRRKKGWHFSVGEKAYNKAVSSVRAAVERVIAHVKSWKCLATDYRRPLRRWEGSFLLVRALYFYRRSF
jgi:hypothetical protein